MPPYRSNVPVGKNFHSVWIHLKITKPGAMIRSPREPPALMNLCLVLCIPLSSSESQAVLPHFLAISYRTTCLLSGLKHHNFKCKMASFDERPLGFLTLFIVIYTVLVFSLFVNTCPICPFLLTMHFYLLYNNKYTVMVIK